MIRSSIVLFALLLGACQQKTEDHDHSSGGHGHEHSGKPSADYTVWTDQTELFVEFPALVVGESSRFAAHFTVLNGHQPVKEGRVTVSLIKGNKGIRHTVDAPSSPGIFTPTLQPKEAGQYQLVFDLQTPTYSDKIVLENIRVFATPEDAESAFGGEDDDSAITFLKEQAWKMAFQTSQVAQKEVYDVIAAHGIWRVAPSDDRMLVAPASGVLKFKPRFLTEGKAIKAGEVLMEITSSDLTTNNLGAEVTKAKATLEQREASYKRIEELYQSQISSKSDYEQAKADYLVAKTNYKTLVSGYTGQGKQVKAPFNGYILEIAAKNGTYTEQGTPLMKVTIDENHMLETRVAPSYAVALENIHDLLYQNGQGEWSRLKSKGGQVISTSREISADDPMLSVFAVVKESIHLPDGSFTEVQIEVGSPTLSMVVPSSSLLEDYGNYSVIVQLSGERFERRNVIIGQRNGSEVAILDGLAPGEVVVTTGAYQVKMAAMADQAPAHGHAH